MSVVVNAFPPITELRLRVRANGYKPIPARGKAPLMSAWQTCLATEADIRNWPVSWSQCRNTGILCGEVVGVDIDVMVPPLTEKIEALAVQMLGATPLRRIGRAPKSLLCYRIATPLPKIETPAMMLNGAKVQVEILGNGQQFIASGIHPDTRTPYVWPDKSPETVPFEHLPEVTENKLRTFVMAAEKMLREAGAAEDKPLRPATANGVPTSSASAKEGGTAYGLKALANECDAIRNAPFGLQESTLNGSALKIGGLGSVRP